MYAHYTTLSLAFPQESCVENLPEFRDFGKHTPSLLVGIQALVPEYKFTCTGVITKWGLAIKKLGRHRIDLQVWRLKEGIQGAYTLVGTNSFNLQPEMGQRLLYLMPNNGEQIAVQPGDVVGFYLENNPAITDDYSVQYMDVIGITVHHKPANHSLDTIMAYTLTEQHSNIAPVLTVEVGKY